MSRALALLLPAALTACTPAPPAVVQAIDPWCQATPAGAPSAGCYLALKASVADRLVGAQSADGLAAEVHTTTLSGGIMRMRPLDQGLPLPAGQSIGLTGATHLMLIAPKAPLVEGGAVHLTLQFGKAPDLTLSVPVRPMGAGAPEAGP